MIATVRDPCGAKRAKRPPLVAAVQVRQTTGAMKHKTTAAASQPSAAHAEGLGDYAQARLLSRAEAGPPAARAAALARYARLGADPMAWRVGAAALCAYTAAWIYALTANR